MMPQSFTIKFFIKKSNMIFGFLCSYIKCYFGKVEVSSYSCCCRDMLANCYLIHQKKSKFFNTHIVQSKIIRDVEKSFIDRINVDIIWSNIIKVNIVNVCGIFYIFFHTRFCDYKINTFWYPAHSTAIFDP